MAQTPFDKVLGCSNLKMLKYEWIWEKTHATGHLNAKNTRRNFIGIEMNAGYFSKAFNRIHNSNV